MTKQFWGDTMSNYPLRLALTLTIVLFPHRQPCTLECSLTRVVPKLMLSKGLAIFKMYEVRKGNPGTSEAFSHSEWDYEIKHDLQIVFFF